MRVLVKRRIRAALLIQVAQDSVDVLRARWVIGWGTRQRGSHRWRVANRTKRPLDLHMGIGAEMALRLAADFRVGLARSATATTKQVVYEVVISETHEIDISADT
ncbi:hypothetical protein [Sulfidibacter corallicola]|uniref:Uncharacterized protein n=1 Tax=Sulfidibacter corallicola TaxID=2818388 RepID=A0A8A4TLC0_SULCO|nr:hypothetical protein [Sulfidibacter corallicola]QTD49681.1 hypothetical protein J3U87_29205 [Sulfidibacter corallicola]